MGFTGAEMMNQLDHTVEILDAPLVPAALMLLERGETVVYSIKVSCPVTV